MSTKLLEELIDELTSSDVLFAKRLHNLQDISFPMKLSSMSEWAEAEKIKRLILGLHDTKTEQSGRLQYTVIHKIVNSRDDNVS